MPNYMLYALPIDKIMQQNSAQESRKCIRPASLASALLFVAVCVSVVLSLLHWSREQLVTRNAISRHTVFTGRISATTQPDGPRIRASARDLFLCVMEGCLPSFYLRPMMLLYTPYC